MPGFEVFVALENGLGLLFGIYYLSEEAGVEVEKPDIVLIVGNKLEIGVPDLVDFVSYIGPRGLKLENIHIFILQLGSVVNMQLNRLLTQPFNLCKQPLKRDDQIDPKLFLRFLSLFLDLQLD